MRTPAGKECEYYFEDYHRGAAPSLPADRAQPRVAPWTPACADMPVPDILQANACPHLMLDAQ